MPTTPEQLSDETYLALCVWDEARGEGPRGRQAVAEIVLNRKARHYQSDGTMRGTVLAPNQFSGFYFDFVGGKYQRVCHDIDAADVRAHHLIGLAQADDVTWPRCVASADAALRMPLGSDLRELPVSAVLYYNPAIVHAPPKWATKEHFVKTIGHHAFYRG